MHRPTLRQRNLEAKLARKAARGTTTGKAIKRMRKWLTAYKPQTEQAPTE